jgi:hypothetical protein
MSTVPLGEEQLGRRVALVLDLDGQPLTVLAVLEELLADLAAWEESDATDPPQNRAPLRLPAPLAGGVALAAVWRLRAGLTPSQFLGPNRARLRGPKGDECLRLSAVVLAAMDIALLSATAQALGHPGLDADVAALLNAHASQEDQPCGREHRAEFIARLAAIAGLLDLAPTEQSRLLTARLTAGRPRRDRALTEADQAAYAHTVDRMIRMWSLGCDLPWHLY